MNEIQQAIDAVADDLRDVERILPMLPSGDFAGGSAGLAVFFTYLALARDDEKEADVAVAYYEHAAAQIAETITRPALYSGFPGIAWVAEHLNGRLFEASEEDDVSEIDEALLTLLRHRPWTRDYDLINGLVGLGVYALEGAARGGPRQCLELVVEQLDAIAVEADGGRTWFTSPDLLPEHQRKAFPDGYFNLGMAHGVPGVVAVLGRTCAAGIAVDKARPLLDDAVRWLLAQQRRESETLFAHLQAEGSGGSEPSRLAWCYGDPGVGVALLGAALAVDQPEWRSEAQKILLHSARRPESLWGIRDTGLCHGTAGLAHIFLRAGRATGDEELLAASRFWLEKTLEMRTPGQGIGGFRSWQVGNLGGESGWLKDPTFLTGGAGVALALLAAISDVSPDWDRPLLTDL